MLSHHDADPGLDGPCEQPRAGDRPDHGDPPGTDGRPGAAEVDPAPSSDGPVPPRRPADAQVPMSPVAVIVASMELRASARRWVHPTHDTLRGRNPPWRWIVLGEDDRWLADGWTMSRLGAHVASLRARRRLQWEPPATS
ncbi:MAG: hypothetical protein S0880_17515 [Actinomycetota bacterium]|nr:hypothetical protein [Actinomycetota bacterium]